MDSFGYHFGFLAFQLLNITILCGWPLLSLLTVFAMRQHALKGSILAIWVAIVLVVPFLGAIAYWIIRPAAQEE